MCLRQQLQVQLSYSTLLRYLHGQEFRLKVPRPCPPCRYRERGQVRVTDLCVVNDCVGRKPAEGIGNAK